MHLNKYDKQAVDEQLASTDIEPDPALRKVRRRSETILLEMAEKMRQMKSKEKNRKKRRQGPRVLVYKPNIKEIQ